MEMKNKIISNRYYPVLFLLFIIAIIFFLIFMVECVTKTNIELQQDEWILDKINGIFPEAIGYTCQNDIYTVYDSDENKLGYAFVTIGEGFYGDIRIMVGLQDENTIKGIVIISHYDVLNEGTEYGKTLDFSKFVEQFVELEIENCSLDKDGGQIDSISGATVSSRAVVDAVRESALEKIQFLE
jgi:electron transport complex protein RnfG